MELHPYNAERVRANSIAQTSNPVRQGTESDAEEVCVRVCVCVRSGREVGRSGWWGGCREMWEVSEACKNASRGMREDLMVMVMASFVIQLHKEYVCMQVKRKNRRNGWKNGRMEEEEKETRSIVNSGGKANKPNHPVTEEGVEKKKRYYTKSRIRHRSLLLAVVSLAGTPIVTGKRNWMNKNPSRRQSFLLSIPWLGEGERQTIE